MGVMRLYKSSIAILVVPKVCLWVSERSTTGSIKDEISVTLYAPWTMALGLFIFVDLRPGSYFFCYLG
jgi:hypothetical protein